MYQSIGKTRVSDLIPTLKEICLQYGLKINRPNDFKLARLLLINLYFNGQEIENF